MKTTIKYILAVALAVAAIPNNMATADTPLVNNSLRNGSFESGSISPWTGLWIAGANPYYINPYEGTYYAQLFTVGSGGVISCTGSIRLPIDLVNGNTLTVSFAAAAHDDTYSLDSLTVTLIDGASRSYTLMAESGALAHNWSSLEYTITLPETFDDSKSSTLRITASRSMSVLNTKYATGIDNIVVNQSVPEPNALIFTSFGFGLLAFVAMRTPKARNKV